MLPDDPCQPQIDPEVAADESAGRRQQIQEPFVLLLGLLPGVDSMNLPFGRKVFLAIFFIIDLWTISPKNYEKGTKLLYSMAPKCN
jgi:hypothetical protein